MVHTVRMKAGKMKGKFVSKKHFDKIESFLCKTQGKQGRVRVSSRTSKIEVTMDSKASSQSREILQGRRIVEPGKLAQDMWCEQCDCPICLRSTVEEKKRGIASIWRIRCQFCFNIIEVETSKKSTVYYDTNLKLAAGMLDAGIGETKLNTFLSAVNIPNVSHTTLKRYENHVGPVIEEIAQQSCIDAINIEKILTIENQEKAYIYEYVQVLKNLNV